MIREKRKGRQLKGKGIKYTSNRGSGIFCRRHNGPHQPGLHFRHNEASAASIHSKRLKSAIECMAISVAPPSPPGTHNAPQLALFSAASGPFTQHCIYASQWQSSAPLIE
ncbi:hypothetical protein XENTR_v10010666 [Xenopus tropicalis]|nr:hypothetical protein XENTR_v10010666 [Xenopus tropicalis]